MQGGQWCRIPRNWGRWAPDNTVPLLSSSFVYLLVVVGVLCLFQVLIGACNECLKSFDLPILSQLLPGSPWANFLMTVFVFFLVVRYALSWVRNRIGFKDEEPEVKRKEWVQMIVENAQLTFLFVLVLGLYIYYSCYKYSS